MNLAQRTLLLLLMLTIPIGGMAGFTASVEPCPMHLEHAHEHAGNSADSPLPPCCQHLDHHPGADTTCKPGQDCSGQSVFQLSAESPPTIASGSSVFANHTPAIPPAPPFRLLRPPRG